MVSTYCVGIQFTNLSYISSSSDIHHYHVKYLPMHLTHCEFLLRNGTGKTCLWKKCIFFYDSRKNQGKKNFWKRTLSFWDAISLAPAVWLIWLALMVQFSSALKRTMCDFKNSFVPNFVFINRVEYVFSKDIFCLYLFLRQNSRCEI